MAQHMTQFVFKGKREHISKINIPNIAYPKQHNDIEIPKSTRDHVIIPDTVKITFILDIESTDKARSVVNNVGRALLKKKEVKFGSTSIDTIDAYKDLYLSEIEREKKLLQGIQSTNGLKAQVGAKMADGTALTLTTQENAIKKAFDNRIAIPSDFDFFKHPVYPYGLKERLIVRLELNSSGEVISCTRDTSATYKFSDISLEYDAIFDEPYATTIGEMYARTSIPCAKVTSIHHQILKKNTLPGRLT